MSVITPTVAGPFIPEVWAQRALDILRANLVLARLVSRDTDYQAAATGDVINIPYGGTFASQVLSPGAAVTPQTPTGAATRTVSLNRHRAVTFLVHDVARAQTDVNLLDNYLRAAATSIAEGIEQDIWALYSEFTESVGTAGNDLTAATIREALRRLDQNRAPTRPRYLVISPKDHVALLSDSGLSSYFAFADRTAIADGAIGRLYGFDVFMSQLAPVVSGTPTTTYNLAFHPDAIVLASRPFRDIPGNTVQTATVVDPDIGIALRVLMGYSLQYLGVQVTVDVLYGVAVLRPELAVVVLT